MLQLLVRNMFFYFNFKVVKFCVKQGYFRTGPSVFGVAGIGFVVLDEVFASLTAIVAILEALVPAFIMDCVMLCSDAIIFCFCVDCLM